MGWRSALKKLLFPRAWVVLLGVLLSAAGLLFVFAAGSRDHWYAYPVYVLSAYSLAAVCARVCRAVGTARQHIGRLTERVPTAGRYLTDVSFRTQVSLYWALALNAAYAVMKMAFGVYYHSVWFGTLAVYYLLLAVTRFALLRYAGKNAFGADRVGEWRRCRLCGIVLLGMNLALTGVVIMAVRDNAGFRYPGGLIYVMAMYAFYSITAAIVNVVKFRRYHSPVLWAAKALHLTAALVSMLALETAMLAQFGESSGEHFRAVMTGSTGGGVCAVIFALALYMLCRSAAEVRATKREEEV